MEVYLERFSFYSQEELRATGERFTSLICSNEGGVFSAKEFHQFYCYLCTVLLEMAENHGEEEAIVMLRNMFCIRYESLDRGYP